jgi:putative ABC transport system ATP-binding protein
MTVLAVSNVRYTYPARSPISFPDCVLEAGEVAALIGPSGSGKSTLLMLIAGLLKLQTGRIEIAGKALETGHGASSDRQRSQSIGMVLQSFQLLPRMTILENLTVAQFLAGRPADRPAALGALGALGIADLAHETPGHLSRGQVQRAAIARAVVNRPALILADEPTSSLDDEAADAALDLLIGESRRRGAALLIATHDSRVKRHVPNVVALTAKAAA